MRLITYTQGGIYTVYTRYTHREAYTTVYTRVHLPREAYTTIYTRVHLPREAYTTVIHQGYPPREVYTTVIYPGIPTQGGIYRCYTGYTPPREA